MKQGVQQILIIELQFADMFLQIRLCTLLESIGPEPFQIYQKDSGIKIGILPVIMQPHVVTGPLAPHILDTSKDTSEISIFQNSEMSPLTIRSQSR